VVAQLVAVPQALRDPLGELVGPRSQRLVGLCRRRCLEDRDPAREQICVEARQGDVHGHRRSAVARGLAKRRRPEVDHLRHVPAPVGDVPGEDRPEEAIASYAAIEALDEVGDLALAAELALRVGVARNYCPAFLSTAIARIGAWGRPFH